MGDEVKNNRYSDLQWDDDDIPLNVNKNTLKQLGEALQYKQDINYKIVSEELKQFMDESPRIIQRCDSKQQKDLLKLGKCNNDSTQKTNKIDSSMAKYIDNNIIATPNQRLLKLQILKKNNTNDNYFRDQFTDRAFDHSEKKIRGSNSSRSTLINIMNKQNSFLEKTKILNNQINGSNSEFQKDIQAMIEEEKQNDKLKERQSYISQTEHMIGARERSQQHNQLLKNKQEEQAANAEKQAMQAEAAFEFKKKMNQVLNQKNKEFIRQFTKMKNENKSKQSEIYQKILDFYQQKNKIDPNEIQLYQDIYNSHQKAAREFIQQIRNNSQPNRQDQNLKQYQVMNNFIKSKSARVCLSAQSQRKIESQQQISQKSGKLEGRKRINTQVTPFEYQDSKYLNLSQHEQEASQINQSQQQHSQKGHSYSVQNMKSLLQNSQQNIYVENSLYEQDLIMKQNNNHYDSFINQKLNRKILSTLRMQKEQNSLQPQKNSIGNASYTQPFQLPTSNESRTKGKQDCETQTTLPYKVRSKTRSPVKINRNTVVDQYQIMAKPIVMISHNRSNSNSPIELKSILKEQDKCETVEIDSPSNQKIDKIKQIQFRQQRQKANSKHISSSHSFLANMFQNQKKLAEQQMQFKHPELQNFPQTNNQLKCQFAQQNNTQPHIKNKQGSLILNKDQEKGENTSDNENNVKSSPTSARNNQFRPDILSFNLFQQIQQNQHNQKQNHQKNLQKQQEHSQFNDLVGINSNLIKQNYSLQNNKVGLSLKNKFQNKNTNISSLSSKLFTQIKERIFMS
ncbi:amine-terminal domain enolase (macronuclear) [Tetrahymena thermophila SB210]|uniref:Amine-terminal domain enolase n=1 Tax=Tetrahymena thermophila (strain SB210) TaxID=312017 RepID=I7MM05_TETTS|nr:amine-terminal domain enolase [Tetrahymena thermophila SB210]EAS03733.3 amine-terminal domain enolase [Tetrahymena thermophila SB210]|eukprot:XP_001023978.3 amine-terminal domain enolase [Tetrahymena thermophila SB210]